MSSTTSHERADTGGLRHKSEAISPSPSMNPSKELEYSEEEVAKYAPTLRGRKLTATIAFVAGTGFTLFGYDQGVMSALLTAPQFTKVFPQVKGGGNHATLQSFAVAIYEIGCLIGAMTNIWLGDRLGRRRTIILGAVVMTIGAILQASSYSFAQLIVARIITGLGNGFNTSTVPSYHAECSHPSKRGSFIMIEGSLISFGIMVSYWIDFGFFWISGSSAQWRVPIALQIIFALIMIVSMPLLPESPRWLIKHERHAEALAVISALEDSPTSSPAVQDTFRSIRHAVDFETEKAARSTSLTRTLLSGGPTQNFRRLCLAMVVQCFQQITGINIITYYATILFERLGLGEVKSRIVAAANGTEYFLASLIAIFVIERIGRRKLMLWCAGGQSLTMILLAVLGKIDNSPSRIISAVLLFVFNSFFAVGWLGMTWLYPAEIVGLNIRAPANALSTATNWLFNFVVVMITGPAFNNIGYRTYIVFAVINAFIVPVVYFFFPETAGRSLEDMDTIFAVAYHEGVSPVEVSLRSDLPDSQTPSLREGSTLPSDSPR